MLTPIIWSRYYRTDCFVSRIQGFKKLVCYA